MKNITKLAVGDSTLARDDHRVVPHGSPHAVWSLRTNGVEIGWSGRHLHEGLRALGDELRLADLARTDEHISVLCRGLPTAIGRGDITHAEAVSVMDATGLTRADIARVIDVSRAAVTKWDNGGKMGWAKWAILKSMAAHRHARTQDAEGCRVRVK